MKILYILCIIFYGVVSFLIGYSTVKIIPIFTPLGGLIETGILFFTALLIHEIVVYRGQKERFQSHQLNFSAETKRLNNGLYILQQSLIKTIEKFNLPFPKLPLVEEINNLEQSLQKKDLDPKSLIHLLDLQLQVLQPLVTTLASLNSQDFFQDPKKGPTLSSGQKPSLSSLEEPDFNLSFNIPQPSLQKDNFASLGRSSDTFIQKPPLKEFSHFPSINREEPTIIPFHKPHSTPPLSSEDNSFLKKNPSFSSSSTVLTKKQIIEQLHHALHQNSFDLLIDKIFHLPTKQVALERCSPFLTIDNQCIFYGQFIQWALEEDLHYYIDHSTLGKVLQLAKESHQQSPALQYLCTVHLNSLMNEEFVHTYIEFAQAYPELCARIIFEINALHFSNLSFIARLQQLSMKGFNFALFSASLECPKELLSNVPFYYYIMDAHQLGFYLQKDSSLTVIQSIKHFLNQHHIEIIMVNINNEEKTVSIFLQFGISYGQGVFFSSPSFNHSLR